MDEIARQVGWLVIIVGAVYLVGKFVIAQGEAKEVQRNKILHKSGIVCRLAYRKVYRSTTDPAIHEEIKRHYQPWFFLDLDLDDTQYHQNMMNGASRIEYQEAIREIEERGDFCKLVDGKLMYRPAQGWHATDALL